MTEAIITGLATGATTLLGLIVAVLFLLNRIDAATASLGAEIREQAERITNLEREQGTRITDVEREQARLEGANGVLAEVLKQQSHTHEVADD